MFQARGERKHGGGSDNVFLQFLANPDMDLRPQVIDIFRLPPRKQINSWKSWNGLQEPRKGR